MATLGVISLSGLYSEDFLYPFLAASGISEASVGKAVTLDTTANTVKLAGDGERVIGKIVTFEDRVQDGVKLVTVATKGGFTFDVNPNATASSPDETPAVGDFLLGATATDTTKGWVQKASTGNTVVTNLQVVEVLNSGAQVVAILS